MSIDELVDFIAVGTATFHSRATATVEAKVSAKLLKKLKKKKRRTIDEEVARKIQSKLKAALIGTTPTVFFSKYDRDNGGTLDAKEFKKLVRTAMRVPKADVSDDDIDVLIRCLDDDGGGEISIDELADFVDKGSATFHDAARRKTKPAMPPTDKAVGEADHDDDGDGIAGWTEEVDIVGVLFGECC